VDRYPFPRIDEAQELTRRRVAEEGAGSARQDGRHPAALSGQVTMADRVDAGMEGVQVTAGREITDQRRGEFESQELPASDDAMLSEGQLGDSWRQWAG